jgi:WD40 repeat protein
MDDFKAKYDPKIESTIEYERQLWQARFSPCGEQLIGCGYDAMIPRWKFSGSEFTPLSPLAGHQGWAQAIGFSKTHAVLLSADSWGKLICWPYQQEAPQPTWSHEDAHDGWIRALAVSADGQLVATAGNDCVVKIWSVVDGQLQHSLNQPDRIFSLCFHPDGNRLVSGDLKGNVREWNFPEAKLLRELDASLLYQQDRIQECGGARCLTFDVSGKYLACAGQKQPQGGFATGFPCVIVFDYESGEPIREMQVGDNNDGFVYDVKFHPDGFVMATSCAFPGKGHLWFWVPDQEQAFYSSKEIPNGRSLSLHPESGRLVMLVSNSANGNGRDLKEGQYAGGTAKIHLLKWNG